MSDTMKMRLRRLPGLVKGYLTRRLMKTDKVQTLIKTIRDINTMMKNFSTPHRKSDKPFMDYCIPHLKKSRHEIHEIFFKYTKVEQMSLIALKREGILNKHYKNGVPISESSYLNYSFRDAFNNSGISSATKKVMQRKTNTISDISGASKPPKYVRK